MLDDGSNGSGIDERSGIHPGLDAPAAEESINQRAQRADILGGGYVTRRLAESVGGQLDLIAHGDDMARINGAMHHALEWI